MRMSGEARLLAACRQQPVDATPVWFMRQAGRCLPEYRRLRERHDILTLARTPELCAEVTLMPVHRFGVDAAVMFADIMLPLTAMGVEFEIQPDIGPIIHQPVCTSEDVDRLRVVDAEEATPYVLEAIRILRPELEGRAALVGFAGAPFTLACYLIEGRPSRNYATAKSFMFAQPEAWHELLHKLSDMMTRYLCAQVAAGAQVVQLFDSWMGALNPLDYERYVLPHTRAVFDALRETGVPTIHFGTATGGLLELMARAGSDIVSVDWRMRLDEAWARIGYERGIQGNLDPVLALAPWQRLREGMLQVLEQAGGRPGHIFNLGHGVLPNTDPDQLAHLVQAVHEETRTRGLTIW